MGTQRCPVASDRTDLATEATLGWSRSSVAGHASGAQRNPVGLGYGGAVARASREISALPDLPPPLPAVGKGRQAGAHLACSGGGITGPRETGTGGGLYRRLLQTSKSIFRAVWMCCRCPSAANLSTYVDFQSG